MQPRMRAPRHVLAALSLTLGMTALGDERAPEPRAQQTPRANPAESSERVNPARRLEAEIEDYPAAPSAATTDPATRIPEVVEEPTPAGSAPKRQPAASSAIAPSEVQRVLGRDTDALALSELDVAQVTLLQQRLREHGLYLGRIDGIVGPQTRAAVQALLRERFELARRLLEQGQMTSELAELVGVSRPLVP
jgi:hypothetical protein